MSLITRVFARTQLTRTVARPLSTSAILRTSAGYGDPQDEKIENQTPLGKSSTDGERKKGRTESIPTNQGSGDATSSGGHGGETSGSSGSSQGSVGSQGGKEGAGNQAKEDVSAQEIRETKKIGEEPKNTAEGGAGPKGG